MRDYLSPMSDEHINVQITTLKRWVLNPADRHGCAVFDFAENPIIGKKRGLRSLVKLRFDSWRQLRLISNSLSTLKRDPLHGRQRPFMHGDPLYDPFVEDLLKLAI